ncbi:DUF6542 domain-containing protein [Actinophytocola sediminis]
MSRGLPWWACVLLTFGLSVVAAIVAMLLQGELGLIYQVAFVLGCVAAICLVQRRSLFGPIVQPPLVFAVTAIGAMLTLGDNLAKGLGKKVIGVAIELTSYFPTMAIATVLTVAIGGYRLWKERDPNPPVRANTGKKGRPAKEPRRPRDPESPRRERTGNRDRVPPEARQSRQGDPDEPAPRRGQRGRPPRPQGDQNPREPRTTRRDRDQGAPERGTSDRPSRGSRSRPRDDGDPPPRRRDPGADPRPRRDDRPNPRRDPGERGTPRPRRRPPDNHR